MVNWQLKITLEIELYNLEILHGYYKGSKHQFQLGPALLPASTPQLSEYLPRFELLYHLGFLLLNKETEVTSNEKLTKQNEKT